MSTITLPKHPYDATKALYAGRSLILITRKATFTAGAVSTAGVVTLAAHGLRVNQAVRFVSGTDGTGLTANKTYYVIAVTDAGFTLSASYGGAAVAPITAYTAAIFAKQHIFGTALVTPKSELGTVEHQEPGDDGILHTVDQRAKDVKETYEFELPETKRLIEIFDGHLNGILSCTAQLFVPDPQADAEGCFALVSDEFAAKVTKSGDQKWGGSDFDKGTLVVTNMESSLVTWTDDVQVVDAA